MATVIPIGEPVNDAERRVIAHLRDHLPSNYLLLHNFEIHRNGEIFEVDLAVIAPHAVYLVDVKGTRGLIEVYGPKWYPERRQPYTSPLVKLRGHARSLKGIITGSQPGRRDLDDIYVDCCHRAGRARCGDSRPRRPGRAERHDARQSRWPSSRTPRAFRASQQEHQRAAQHGAQGIAGCGEATDGAAAVQQLGGGRAPR